MFWQSAWEVWQQWNEVVHKASTQGQNILLYQEVQQEYQQGIHLLPISDHHWVSDTLPELLQHSPTYLRGWLQMVKVIWQ